MCNFIELALLLASHPPAEELPVAVAQTLEDFGRLERFVEVSALCLFELSELFVPPLLLPHDLLELLAVDRELLEVVRREGPRLDGFGYGIVPVLELLQEVLHITSLRSDVFEHLLGLPRLLLAQP